MEDNKQPRRILAPRANNAIAAARNRMEKDPSAQTISAHNAMIADAIRASRAREAHKRGTAPKGGYKKRNRSTRRKRNTRKTNKKRK